MNTARCTICRQQLPTIKTLKSHYMTKHSKFQIVKELLKTCLLNSTPNVITKSKKKRDTAKYKTIYVHENVQVTYSNDTIVIQDESGNDNLIELTFNEGKENPNNHSQTVSLECPEAKRKSRKNRKSKKLFHIGIRKIMEAPKSLHEHTGEFYECHCMEKQKFSSDTESCSDTGKSFYCSCCGSGYQSATELHEHEKVHQFQCKICNQTLTIQNYREHVQQHILRVYTCHVCGFEFICKEILVAHMGYHFEQQTFENVLNMEQEYNMYGGNTTNFSSGDYYTDINNILFFLTYPYDHYYIRNMFRKVFCDICYQELFIYDYDRHMKIAHYAHCNA